MREPVRKNFDFERAALSKEIDGAAHVLWRIADFLLVIFRKK